MRWQGKSQFYSYLAMIDWMLMGKNNEHLHDATNDKLPSDKEADKMNKESDKLAQELGFNSDVWEGSE